MKYKTDDYKVVALLAIQIILFWVGIAIIFHLGLS